MTLSQVARDSIVNVVFAVVKGLVLLLAIGWVAGAMLPAALGAFLFARRLASTLANLAQMGMSQTLVRYVPMYPHGHAARRALVIYALIAAIVISSILLTVVLVAAEPIGAWLFPQAAEPAAILTWSAVILVGTIFHFISYAAFIAERRMVVANMLELMNVSGFLLIILVWNGFELDLVDTLKWLGMSVLSLGLLAGLVYVAGGRPAADAERESWAQARQKFVQYGLPRGVISFLDMCTLTIGPWLVREDPVTTAYLLLAFVVLRVLATAILPVSQVLSVVTAGLLGKEDETKISTGFRLLFGALLYASLFALVFFAPWGRVLVGLWLGDETLAAGVWEYVAVIGFGLVPLIFFYGMRGVIETRWLQPKNLLTISVALAVQVALYFLLLPQSGAAVAIQASVLVMLMTMGILTLWWVRGDVFVRNYYGTGALLTGAGLVLATGLMCKQFFPASGFILSIPIGILIVPGVFRARGWPAFLLEARQAIVNR